MPKCSSKAANGKPCKRSAVRGHLLCASHINMAERCNLREEEFRRGGFTPEAMCALRRNPVVVVDPQKLAQLRALVKDLSDEAVSAWDTVKFEAKYEDEPPPLEPMD